MPTTDDAASTHHLIPIAALIFCCLFWGYSFPVMQIATDAFDRHVLPAGADPASERHRLAARALFNGLRFGLAALLYGGVTFKRQHHFRRDDVVGGAAVGAFFGGAMLLQVIGLRWTLPSVSSFFTALPVVFAPVIQALFLKQHKVGRATWLAVAIAFVGIVLLSWPKPDAVAANTRAAAPPLAHLGELITIGAALVFTIEIIFVHRFGQTADPVRLTFVMLVTTSVLSLTAGTLIAPALLRPSAAIALLKDRDIAWTMATLVAISSVLALHLMNTFQPRVSPATASVVYCTEPLFGTMFSLIFATEKLAALTIAGGLAVVVSVLVVAIPTRTPTPHPPA